MFVYFIEENNIYIAFSDLTKKIFEQIDKLKLDKSTKNSIKDFIVKNNLDDNLFRQKNYVNSLSTYIDSIKNYNLFVYIVPKEIKLKNVQNNKETIQQIEKLAIQIFKLYSKLMQSEKIKYTKLKEYKGNSFLELELLFYIEQLDLLYNYLLNYKKNSKNIIICSDKIVGLEIEDLTILEDNPLKNYQFIKQSHQKELIIFLYSLVDFLQKTRIEIFKNEDKYKLLKNRINKIVNFLQKISDRKLDKEKIIKNNLKSFFDKYKNKKELKQNKTIFDIMRKLFLNQLNDGVFFIQKIDLTKMFEAIIQKRLAHYGDKLYIGDENKSKILGKGNENLNKTNHLLKYEKQIKQYPDFLIKEGNIYHVLDAKYKLYDSLFKSRDIFWQILIYAKLFNKDKNLMPVNKVIIYINNFEIDISKIISLDLDSDKIEIDSKDIEIIPENVFDTNIKLIKISILTCK